MKKRVFLLLLCVLTLAISLCLFTACDEGGKNDGGKEPCTHSYTSAVTKEAGCETTGTLTYTCSLCGDSYTEPIAAKGHSHSTDYVSDATHHYYLCACGDKKDKGAHVSSGPATATEDETCTVCGHVISPAIGISFKTLTVTGNQVYGKVSNSTEYFSFINEVTSTGGAKYIVSNNITGTQAIPAKTIDLTVGDNRVYIIELIDDEPSAVYTVTVRRKPIYEVTFDTNGGSEVPTQYIEEDSLATEPTTTIAGYTLSWDYDFTTPITDNTKITANWTANDNTPYRVEYYRQNVDLNGYDLISSETINTSGKTDTTAYAPEKTFDHFNIDKTQGKLSGNIDGEGKLVLKVYYTRNTYTVKTSISDSNGGTVTEINSTYPYGAEIKLSVTVNSGYTFNGYFVGTQNVCSNESYTFTVEESREIVANITANTGTKYIVKCFFEKLDKNGYDLKQTKTLYGTTGYQTVVQPGKETGFTLDTSKSILSGIITGDENLVLEVYYTRNTYTISTTATAGGTVSGGGEYAYGKEITLTATTKPGYKFAGWYQNNSPFSSSAVCDVYVSGDKSFEARWTANTNTPYKVEYYFENVNKNGYVLDSTKTETRYGTTDTEITIEDTFDHFIIDKTQGKFSGNIDGEGTLVLKVYYSRNCTNFVNGVCSVCGSIRNGNKIAFGSYPQTEVTDSTLKSTLSGKAGTLPTSGNSQNWTSYGYYISGSVSNYMWYIDVEEGGEKYRGVYFTSYRPYYTEISSSSSDTYQDNNGYNTGTVYWFKYEPIIWTILNENTTDGTALILCDMIIDSQQYDYDGLYSNNYANSTIRQWLNETFYNTAFTELQKQLIITTTVDNSLKSTGYSSNPYVCEDTEDKIFLLSYEEATNSSYGLNTTTRQKKTTDYAQAQGAYTSTSTGYAGNGWWWLRSPINSYSIFARAISGDGDGGSYDVSDTGDGVVPALQIRL